MATTQTPLDIDSVRSYIQSTAKNYGTITYFGLVGIHIVIKNPSLASYPRLVDVLSLFTAIWGKIFREDYQSAKDVVGMFNQRMLSQELSDDLILTPQDTKLASIAQKVLLTEKQKAGEAIYISKQKKLDAFVHFKNVVTYSDKLDELLPRTGRLRRAYRELMNEGIGRKDFKSQMTALADLNELLIHFQGKTDNQKERLKLTLNLMSKNIKIQDLIQLDTKINKISYINEVPEEEFKKAFFKSSDTNRIKAQLLRNDTSTIITQLKKSAIAAHWNKGRERILVLSEKTTFNAQLLDYLTQTRQAEESISHLMDAIEELSSEQLPEQMRIDPKAFMSSLLQLWRWAPDESMPKEQQAHKFFNHLNLKVHKVLHDKRTIQYEQMHFLAEECGGVQFGNDFRNYYPKQNDAHLQALVDSSFVRASLQSRLEDVFKNKVLATKLMTKEEYSKLFPNGKIAARFFRFQSANLDKDVQGCAQEFYAWLNQLVEFRSSLLPSKSVFGKLKAMFKENPSEVLIRDLSNIWINELFNSDSTADPKEWREPLLELVRIASEVNESEVQFGPEIIKEVLRKFSLEQGFPTDINKFRTTLEENPNLAQHFLAGCHQEVQLGKYVEELKTAWIHQFTSGCKTSAGTPVDAAVLDVFKDEFEPSFFNGGVNQKNLTVLQQAVREGFQLAVQTEIDLSEIAKAYTAYFLIQGQTGEPLSLPDSLELMPFCENASVDKWKDTFLAQFGPNQLDSANRFLDVLDQDDHLSWAPRIPQEIDLAVQLYQETMNSFAKGGHSNSSEALDAVAEGCIAYLKALRDNFQPLTVPNDRFSFIYKARLPEVAQWKTDMTDSLGMRVVGEIEARHLRGPFSQRELGHLESYLKLGNQIAADGLYSEETVAVAIRRVIAVIRSEGRSFKSISRETLMHFCFEGYVETLVPGVYQNEQESVIDLLNSISRTDKALSARGKSCLQRLVKLILFPNFAGGRNLDQFRVKAKFPELLDSLHLSNIDALNSYPFEDLLEQLFAKQSEHLFSNLNVRETLEVLREDPKTISLVLTPLLETLTGQSQLDYQTKKELNSILDLLSVGEETQAAMGLVTKYLGAVKESGAVEMDIDISTEKVANGLLNGITALKKEEFGLTFADRNRELPSDQAFFVRQLVNSLVDQFAEDQINRKEVYSDVEEPPIVELLNGLQKAPSTLTTVLTMGTALGNTILSIPFFTALLKKILTAVINRAIELEIRATKSDISTLATIVDLNKEDANILLTEFIASESAASIKLRNKHKIIFLKELLHLTPEGRREKLRLLKIQSEVLANVEKVSPALISIGMKAAKNILSKIKLKDFQHLMEYVVQLSQDPEMPVDKDRLTLAFYESFEALLVQIPELLPNLLEGALGGLKKIPLVTEYRRDLDPKILSGLMDSKYYGKALQKVELDPILHEQFTIEFEQLSAKEFDFGFLAPIHKKNIKKAIDDNQLLNKFKDRFADLFATNEMSSQQVKEIVYLVEVAASIINENKLDPDEVVEGCYKYCEELLKKDEQIKAPVWNHTLGWVGDYERQQVLSFTGTPASHFKRLSDVRFQEVWSDLPTVKSMKKIAREQIIPAFDQHFTTIFSDPSFSRDQVDEIGQLVELAALMVMRDGYSAEEAAMASKLYCEVAFVRGEYIKIVRDGAFDKIANMFNTQDNKYAAELCPYAFDYIVGAMARDLSAEGTARLLPDSPLVEDRLEKKVLFYLNHMRIGESALPLNANGRAALKEVISAFMDPEFAAGKELLNPLLLQRGLAILQVAGLADISALNQIEDPSFIRRRLIEEAEVRLEKLNLGRLQAALLKHPDKCIAEVAHPLVENLLQDSSAAEKEKAKKAIDQLSSELANAPLAKSLQNFVKVEFGQFNPFDGIDIDLDVSLSQVSLTTGKALDLIAEDLDKEKIPTADEALNYGIMPWLVIKLSELFTQAQDHRNEANLKSAGSQQDTQESSELLANVLDAVGNAIGTSIKLFETFTSKGFFGQMIGETASNTSTFIEFLVKNDLVKALTRTVLGSVFYFKIKKIQERDKSLESQKAAYKRGKADQAQAQAEIDQLKEKIKQNKKSVLAYLYSNEIKESKLLVQALRKGMKGGNEGTIFINDIKAEKVDLKDASVFYASLQKHLDCIVELTSSILVSVLSRHDLSKHGALMGHFIDLAAHPEKKLDQKFLLEHLLSSFDVLLAEFPEFYGDLIPGVLGAITSAQRFDRD